MLCSDSLRREPARRQRVFGRITMLNRTQSQKALLSPRSKINTEPRQRQKSRKSFFLCGAHGFRHSRTAQKRQKEFFSCFSRIHFSARFTQRELHLHYRTRMLFDSFGPTKKLSRARRERAVSNISSFRPEGCDILVLIVVRPRQDFLVSFGFGSVSALFVFTSCVINV